MRPDYSILKQISLRETHVSKVNATEANSATDAVPTEETPLKRIASFLLNRALCGIDVVKRIPGVTDRACAINPATRGLDKNAP